MQGRILSEGVLRAEDGKRYIFSMSDIQNSQGIDDLIGLEVDFELEDGVAKELIVVNIRQSSLQNNANTPNSATQQRDYDKCVELDPGIKSTYKIFHGVIHQNNESITSSTEGKIDTSWTGSVKGNIKTIFQKTNTFKIGDKTFIYQSNNSKFLLTNQRLFEDGDEISVISEPKPIAGYYHIHALKNHTKDYLTTKHNSTIEKIVVWLVLIVSIMGLFGSIKTFSVGTFFLSLFLILVVIICIWILPKIKAFAKLVKFIDNYKA
ncbi:hypothetical protein [Campylobacter lanienae]|uniref:hypothetical protein n=1 Tax=Campylobacter lanienae TaxID=75658 RepID=UPI000BB4447A|nr:hypothetical protein [Campylobacter lanienae]